MPELCVALDVSSVRDAVAIADAVGDTATWYKVGPVLHVKDGAALLRELDARGKRVFLDLKWHDIPNTVAGAVSAASALGVSLATVHLLGGAKMLEAAARARNGGGTRIIGVGMLTSHSAADFGDVVGRRIDDASQEQERLIRLALGAGLDGFVSAVAEVARVRAIAGPKAFLVTPGIRRAGDAAGDQQRTATPAEAVQAGSDLLVVGRPISGAANPGEAAREIRRQMAS
jgi:orotidine-5'-phosphate decarboxylase